MGALRDRETINPRRTPGDHSVAPTLLCTRSRVCAELDDTLAIDSGRTSSRIQGNLGVRQHSRTRRHDHALGDRQDRRARDRRRSTTRTRHHTCRATTTRPAYSGMGRAKIRETPRPWPSPCGGARARPIQDHGVPSSLFHETQSPMASSAAGTTVPIKGPHRALTTHGPRTLTRVEPSFSSEFPS